MDVVLAQPRGFCAGVNRAVEIVERSLSLHGAPVYVFHEIVHNAQVVAGLRKRGAVFVNDVEEIPYGAVTIFSAHGVSNAITARAVARGLRIIDATCPLVSRVHLRAQRYARLGFHIVIVGHRGHEEVEGTMGSVDGECHVVSSVEDVEDLRIPAETRLAYVTQTTLSLDDTREIIGALRRRFPRLEGPDLDDICYATQNRQMAVKRLAQEVDLILVVGARNSSNSNRLREVASQHAASAYLISDHSEIDPRWLTEVRNVGVTAGASTPEDLVQGVCRALTAYGAANVRELSGPREIVRFRLPDLLGVAARAARRVASAVD